MKKRILLLLLFTSTITFSQSDKPIVIHEFVQEDAAENIVGRGNKFKADKVLGASCWNDLDPDYININNTMYGNESYSSSNPLDDGSYGPIELGWTFTFYGVDYTTLYINANGNVTFGNLYSAYSARGFPSTNVPAMISPFWADADLRGAGTGANQIYVKLESNKITIQWVGVGYYNQKTNLTNTFQLVLTDGSDPEIGIGYNTRFAYGDMNWCVGDASGGTNGFGSNVYATVGAQSAGGSNYYQIGLFSNDNSSYDGSGGSLDGVHYLDGRCFTMDLRNTNVPPVANDLPESREISLCPNMTYSLSSSFSAPEISQTTSTTVTNNTLSNFTFTSQNGNLSLQTINISATAQDVGTHYIYYQSTDNGTPAGITYDTVKVNVYECSSSGYPSSFYLDGTDDYAVVQNHNALYSGGSGTYSSWVFPESSSQVGEIPILSKADQFFLGINGVTNIPVFRAYVSGVWYTLTGSTSLDEDKWNHLAATVTGNKIKLYVNGAVDAESDVAGIVNISKEALFVGTSAGKELFFKGKLDEITIWSRFHTDQEIEVLRWEIGEVSDDYLRAYFKCTNSIVLTNEVNSFHGVLNNVDINTCWKANYASVWDGSESSDFFNKDNWEEGLVPDPVGSGSIEPNNFVIVPNKGQGNILAINSTVEVNNIIFKDSSQSTILGNGKLKVFESLYTYDNIDHQGEVIFSGFDNHYLHGENTFQKLTVDGNITLKDNQKVKELLTLNTGALNVNNKELTVVSNSVGTGQIFHNSGYIVGEVNLERYVSYVPTTQGWHYLSSCVKNMQFSKLDNTFKLYGLGNSFTDTPRPNVYMYNESVVNPDKIVGWESPTSLSSELDNLQGYIISHAKTSELILNVKGEVNSGSISQNLTHTVSSNTNADGWNLIGNPYPSMVNWDLVTFPNQLENAKYIYDTKNDQYSSYVNGVGVNGGTNEVATMQGFFVKANANVSFEMTNDIRVVGDNSSFRRGKEDVESSIIKLKSSGVNCQDETVVRFNDKATVLFDKSHDARKLFGSNNSINMYTIAAGIKTAINSMPYSHKNEKLPLVLEVQNQGVYSVELVFATNLDFQKVYLEDVLNDTIHDLSDNPIYSFNTITSNSKLQFNLFVSSEDGQTVGSDLLDTKEPELHFFDGHLYLENIVGLTDLNVTAISGSVIKNFSIDSKNGSFSMVLNELRPGVYVVQCNNKSVMINRKIIIK